MTIQQILLKYWGYSQFRPLQEDIINSVMEGNDTLALMPTGGGKSICFQIPALAKDGICIVISPLIALMKDQVENLKAKGIKALAITSAMSKNEIDAAFENCAYGNYKFLYLSPERLETDLARARIQKMKVNLIAVDEAHCISQWGYDFRPSYLKISEIRDLHPQIPVLALSATATPEVAKDIQNKLLFNSRRDGSPKENLLRKSFERKNLAYVVFQEEDKMNRLLKMAEKIHGTGIVYVRNRKKTQEVANFLKRHNVAADFYHAGLDSHVRDAKQDAWINNKVRVIVCTNAFGMGIDKPDVRFVVHLDMPDCLEAYFQEAGRAGRDEKKSYAVLLYNDADKIEMEHNLEVSFPSMEEIRKTYQALANYFQLPIGAGKGSTLDFDIHDFCSRYNLKPLVAFNAIKLLEREGYFVMTDAFYQPSRVHFLLNKEELYKFQVENVHYDEFIKIVLRSYSGVFDSYVKISDQDIGKKIRKTWGGVKNIFLELEKRNVLKYLPQTEMPRITFLTERTDAKDIFISADNLRKRKEKTEERMAAMIHYATSKTKCRSQMLLSYFGETDSYRCGICDICLERNKLELSSLEFESVSEQIKKKIALHPLTLIEIVDSVQNSSVDKTIRVVQWLIDNGKLIYSEDNKLTWRK
ncbi:MAG: RecQ family ATP-dependent DNA helicase [Bacteroidetes bacterium]|nr:RecQ family ATP-dependent DNA helicase [Bacteroidota bacterium]